MATQSDGRRSKTEHLKPTAADIGLAEYARQVGRTKQFLSQLVQAAEVAKASSQLDGLQDKTQHLAATGAGGSRC